MLKMIYLGITLLNVLMVMVVNEELERRVKEEKLVRINFISKLSRLVALIQFIILIATPILHFLIFGVLMITTMNPHSLEIAIDKVIEENYL